MGCDIHMISQVKKPDGSWQTYDTDIYNVRNYEIFGILAGVRSINYHSISEPRGLPRDTNDISVMDSEFDGPHHYDPAHIHVNGFWLGEHSFSYLTLEELEAYDWKQKSIFENSGTLEDGRFHVEVMGYLRAVADKHGGPKNVRIVFGFDS